MGCGFKPYPYIPVRWQGVEKGKQMLETVLIVLEGKFGNNGLVSGMDAAAVMFVLRDVDADKVSGHSGTSVI